MSAKTLTASPAAVRWSIPGALPGLMAGLAIRLFFLARTDFPIGDGGLFYSMIEDLHSNGYVLPEYASYNGGHIPFAYPPLALYLAAAVTDLGHWSILQVLQVLPAAVSLLTIVAFYGLARRLVSRDAATVGAIVFAVLPGSFLRIIMGGGITRSAGLLFAILGLYFLHRALTEHPRAPVILAPLFLAASVLAHPEAGWFAAYSAALLVAAFGRTRRNLSVAALIAGAVAVLTSPWWLTVIGRYGIGILGAASNTGSPSGKGILLLLTLDIVEGPGAPAVAALAVLGMVASLGSGRRLLTAWLVAVLLLDPRDPYMKAVVPASILAGQGLTDLVLPLLATGRLALLPNGGLPPSVAPHGLYRRLAPGAFAAALLGCVAFVSVVGQAPSLQPLSTGEREAMAWTATNTPRDAVFLVVAPAYDDRGTAEWFPALTQRQSPVTTQGQEWAGPGEFDRRQALQLELAHCADQSSACIDAWAARSGVSFSYIFVPERGGEWAGPLRKSLERNTRYRLVFRGTDAAIYEVASN